MGRTTLEQSEELPFFLSISNGFRQWGVREDTDFNVWFFLHKPRGRGNITSHSVPAVCICFLLFSHLLFFRYVSTSS